MQIIDIKNPDRAVMTFATSTFTLIAISTFIGKFQLGAVAAALRDHVNNLAVLRRLRRACPPIWVGGILCLLTVGAAAPPGITLLVAPFGSKGEGSQLFILKHNDFKQRWRFLPSA